MTKPPSFLANSLSQRCVFERCHKGLSLGDKTGSHSCIFAVWVWIELQIRNGQSLTIFKRSDVLVTDHVYISYLHSNLCTKKQAVKLVLYVIVLSYCTRMLEKTLETPLDCKEMKAVSPKGNQPWIFIGRTVAEAKAPILWPPDAKSQLIGIDPDAGEDWRQKEKGGGRGWDGKIAITDSMDMNLSKFQDIVEDRRGCYHPWNHKELGTASDWTITTDCTSVAEFETMLLGDGVI